MEKKKKVKSKKAKSRLEVGRWGVGSGECGKIFFLKNKGFV
jgi:hypothetical protein